MSSPKITLDPNEDNELGFNLSIEGKTSDVDSTKPNIRFVVKEQASNRAIMFDNIKHENGMAKIVLPSNEAMFTESKDYVGSLEVILGKHYFVATTVNLEFIEPLKVEATVVLNKGKGNKKKTAMLEEEVESPLQEVEAELKIESEIDSVIIKTKPTMMREAPTKKKRREKLSYRNLSDKEKDVVNTIFVAECKKLGIDDPKKYLKDGTSYTKKRLKAMLVEATKRVAVKRQR